MDGFTPITDPDPDLPFTGPTPPNGIPADLWDLMHANGVTERELQDTVGYAGYFPADMPIRDYPEDFVRGCLVGAWDSVYTAIKSARGGN